MLSRPPLLEPREPCWCNSIVRVVAIFALVVAVAAAIEAPAPAVRPFTAQKGPTWYAGPPIGLVWNLAGPGPVLARLDPETLEPTEPRLAIGRSVSTWSYDPTRRWLAVSSGPELRFVDTDRLRVVGQVRLEKKWTRVSFLAWLYPDRFVAVYARPRGAEVGWVDPVSHQVLERRHLDAMPWKVASGGGTAVALLPPPRTVIGGARLAIARRDGRLHIVSVTRIQIGWEQADDRDRGIFHRVSPGLAVSSAGERAYLVGGAGVVAEVDLHSLAVSYHSPQSLRSLPSRIGSWLVPAAQAKGLEGPDLRAQWLGNGIVAVAGTRSHLLRRGQIIEPVGLRLVDTRRWTLRTLENRATGFALAGDTLLAFGVRSEWSNGTLALEGMGISAFGPDGSTRFKTLPNEPFSYVQVGQNRAYAWRLGPGPSWRVVVVDVANGTVEQELTLTHPTRLILGDPTNG